MGGRVSRKTQVARRFSQLRKTFQVDTQRLRVKAVKGLEELFDLAKAFAQGTYKFQYEKGKREPLTMKQRQMWARIAAYAAQIMNTIANGIDDRQIDKDLALLEKLVNEATAKNNSSQRKPGDGQETKTPARALIRINDQNLLGFVAGFSQHRRSTQPNR